VTVVSGWRPQKRHHPLPRDTEQVGDVSAGKPLIAESTCFGSPESVSDSVQDQEIGREDLHEKWSGAALDDFGVRPAFTALLLDLCGSFERNLDPSRIVDKPCNDRLESVQHLVWLVTVKVCIPPTVLMTVGDPRGRAVTIRVGESRGTLAFHLKLPPRRHGSPSSDGSAR
jgi:hypothetical protein